MFFNINFTTNTKQIYRHCIIIYASVLIEEDKLNTCMYIAIREEKGNNKLQTYTPIQTLNSFNHRESATADPEKFHPLLDNLVWQIPSSF